MPLEQLENQLLIYLRNIGDFPLGSKEDQLFVFAEEYAESCKRNGRQIHEDMYAGERMTQGEFFERIDKVALDLRRASILFRALHKYCTERGYLENSEYFKFEQARLEGNAKVNELWVKSMREGDTKQKSN